MKQLARRSGAVALLGVAGLDENTMTFRKFRIAVLAGSALSASLTGAPAQDCAICAKSVVINADLAQCFLDKYPKLGEDAGAAVAVDLSKCSKARSIVQALPAPAMAVETPDTKFLLSRRQMECLRARIIGGDIKLDPSARIDLAACP